ncbi:MAG: hypothetical protein AB2A00_00795 [Myxococcota bacterium]
MSTWHPMRLLVVALPALFLALTPETARADRQVIQNRTYRMQHEFTLEGGVLPLDVLYKAGTVTGRYTFHFNDFLAWEALSLTYAPMTDISILNLGFGPFRFNHFTQQGNDLQDNHGYDTFDVDQLRLFAESNLVLKPLYGKFSFFNRANARVELFGVLGGAVANFIAYRAWPFQPEENIGTVPPLPATAADIFPKPGQTLLIRPGVNFGGGTRLYVGEHFSVRLDARSYTFLEGYTTPKAPVPRELPEIPVGFTQVLYLGVGTSLSFGGGL